MLVRCSSCTTRFNIPDAKIAGRRARMKCKRCGTPIAIDGTSVHVSIAAEEAPPPPELSSDSSPPRRRRASSLSTRWRVMEPSGKRHELSLGDLANRYEESSFEPGTLVCQPGADEWLPPYDFPEVVAKAYPGGVAPARAAQPTFTDDTVTLGLAESVALTQQARPTEPKRDSEHNAIAGATDSSAPPEHHSPSPTSSGSSRRPLVPRPSKSRASGPPPRRFSTAPAPVSLSPTAGINFSQSRSPGAGTQPMASSTEASGATQYSRDALLDDLTPAPVLGSGIRPQLSTSSSVPPPSDVDLLDGLSIRSGRSSPPAGITGRPVSTPLAKQSDAPSHSYPAPSADSGPAKLRPFGSTGSPAFRSTAPPPPGLESAAPPSSPSQGAMAHSSMAPAAQNALGISGAPITQTGVTPSVVELSLSGIQTAPNQGASRNVTIFASFLVLVSLCGATIGMKQFQPGLFDLGLTRIQIALGATSSEDPKGVRELPFDAPAAGETLRDAASTVTSCRQATGPEGRGRVQVLYQPSGQAAKAAVSRPFNETRVGTCLVKLFQSTKVPAFAGAPVLVTKTFDLR